ncbi:hypothetical protein FAM23853_000979 [Propionibacterium freudenreichii]|uniref:DUF7687 domain-containing protein n=1 Tax=Propionibacterium freudenreichii TaxID=1744 RepID=UPI00254AE78F|nr:hypothetical protein [Propionibacterium freudenreichii]MDK9339741.1 hypothetical protein [Propionibacterium freudenreichii]
MRADPAFLDQPINFWAYVRAITEALGSARRGSNTVADYTLHQIIDALQGLDRPTDVLGTARRPSTLGQLLEDYFSYRADLLNNQVRDDLMTADQAEIEFNHLVDSYSLGEPKAIVTKGVMVAQEYLVCGLPVRIAMNKQKGLMRRLAYLTGMIDIIVAHALQGQTFDSDPRKLITVDDDHGLYATLSRRMDGAYPSTTNPIAVWEIKEYYYTTTFGSKISDAVYITDLDGREIGEVSDHTGRDMQYLMMIDAYDTWWIKGKSYLCRLIDLLNMGRLDHLLVGREVLDQLPEIAASW